MFFERFNALCTARGISATAACKSIGLQPSNIPAWRKGVFPNNSTIRRVSEYFGVPVTYFTASEKAEQQTVIGNGNNIGGVTIHGDNNRVEVFTASEKALIELFRQLDPIRQAYVITNLDKMTKEDK